MKNVIKNRNFLLNNITLDIIATTEYSSLYLPRDNQKVGDKLQNYIESIVKNDIFYNFN